MTAPHDDSDQARFAVEFVAGYLYRLRNLGPTAHGLVMTVGDDVVTPGLPHDVTVLSMAATEPFFLRMEAGPPSEVVVRCDEHGPVRVAVP